MGYVERLILSNGLALVCFPLVVFNNVRANRDRMLKLSTAMMMLTIAVYAIIGCFDAVASTLFSVLRNYACLKFDGRKGGAAIKVAILLAGTAFSAGCGYLRGGDWVAYLPAASFLFCSSGYYLTRSSRALRIINAADILLFWLVFDYLNLMVFNVATDLFVVLFPLAERYVQLDKTGSAQGAPKTTEGNSAYCHFGKDRG